MAFIDGQQLVQAFVSDHSDPPLGKSIRVRSANRGADDMNSLNEEDAIEGLRELRIVVVDQELNERYVSLEVPDDLACLLVHPGRVGMLGTTCNVDATAAHFDQEEHVQRLQKERLHRGEIAGQDLVFVMAHQMTPTWRAASFGSARNAVSSQNGTDGLIAEFNAQLGKFTGDPGVAPISILAC